MRITICDACGKELTHGPDWVFQEQEQVPDPEKSTPEIAFWDLTKGKP